MLNRPVSSYLEKTYVSLFKMTPLHSAALKGDLAAVKEIIEKNPEQYSQLTAANISSKKVDEEDCQNLSATSALHYALLAYQYDVVKYLLAQPNCKNIIDHHAIPILELIAKLPDKQQASQFASTICKIKKTYLNDFDLYGETELHRACQQDKIELADLLLRAGADPNNNDGTAKETTPIQILAIRLKEASSADKVMQINKMISLLLDYQAKPEEIDKFGKNFFDYIAGSEDKLDPAIKLRLSSIWNKSSFDHIIERQVSPFTDEDKSKQSPAIENVALAVQLKRERRLAANLDYDCTVLYSREQFLQFLELTKLRAKVSIKPFQTHFILRPRKEHSPHVSGGQLEVDANGNVNVFWIETLGHEKLGQDQSTAAIETNKEIGELIRKQFPQATLYTVDNCIQSTPSGCQHLTMYIIEQLSAAKSKNKDLFHDLNLLYKETQDGFRIVPWNACPAYTGLPRITQSYDKPTKRISMKFEADQQPLNKELQNYEQAMKGHLISIAYLNFNTFYNTKRTKAGSHLKKGLETFDSTTVEQKRFLGFIDVVNRIPVNALSALLNVKLKEGKNNNWEISIPDQYNYKNMLQPNGTLEELNQQLKDMNKKISTDMFAYKNPNMLYQYAAIKVITDLVKNAKLELENKQSLDSKTKTGITKLIFGKKS